MWLRLQRFQKYKTDKGENNDGNYFDNVKSGLLITNILRKIWELIRYFFLYHYRYHLYHQKKIMITIKTCLLSFKILSCNRL